MALASFWRRSRSFCGDWRRYFWGDPFCGLEVGRAGNGAVAAVRRAPFKVGILESEVVGLWPFSGDRSPEKTSLGRGSSDMIFWARSVRPPTVRVSGVFSFCGEPAPYVSARFTTVFVGEGVLGEELNLDCCRVGSRDGSGDMGEDGEASVAEAIKAFKSESELRRFFFNDLVVAGSSGGGDASIVVILV